MNLWLSMFDYYSTSRCNARPFWKHQKYTKEQFFQANCQFIVKEGNDYSKHCLDPDLFVDWNAVEEIRFNFLKSEITICPICLYEPVAAKVTRCGHIYCWGCILHYFALTDKKWRKCPICFVEVCQDDLRSVSSMSKLDFKVGEDIVLSLMKRKKGSVVPSFITQIGLQTFTSAEDDLTGSSFKKLIIATPAQVLNTIIAREYEQLNQLYEKEKDTPEACFIENALKQLDERKSSLMALSKLKEAKQFKSISNTKKRETVNCLIKETTGVDGEEDTDLNQSSEAKEKLQKKGEKIVKITDEDGEVRMNLAEKSRSKPCLNSCTNNDEEVDKEGKEDYYFFYQSIDGQHIYLNPLNVKMLCEQYGSLEKCPPLIEGKIVEITWSFMDEPQRKRLRYLQHLPLNCEFKIVEMELTKPKINEQIMEKYKDEIEKRQKMRNKRALEEKKRDNHINLENSKKMYGMYHLPQQYHSESANRHQAVFNEHTFASFRSRLNSSQSSSTNEELEIASVGAKDDTNILATSPPEFVSFATMLKANIEKPMLSRGAVKSVNLAENEAEDVMYNLSKPLHTYSLSDAFEAAMVLKASKKKKGSNK